MHGHGLTRKNRWLFGFVLFSLLAFSALYSKGGGKGVMLDSAGSHPANSLRIYQESPVIEIQGNLILRDNPEVPGDLPYLENRHFNPRTPLHAEAYDSDLDGIADEPINSLKSLVNAANRLLDLELAACVSKAGSVPPGGKHLGYTDPASRPYVWVENWLPISGGNQFRYQYPDTMPATADASGTDGTQYLQLIVPYAINGPAIFDRQQADYLNSEFLTIEDEQGNHVPCTVLVNGKDARGNGPERYQRDPQWSQLAGINVTPRPGTSSIVFIAQPTSGILGDVPDHLPFALWNSMREIRIHLKKIESLSGEVIDLNAKWYVLKEGVDGLAPEVLNIEATEPVLDGSGAAILDPDSTPAQEIVLVHRDSSFLIHFSKPVIPETVGHSITFARAHFNGNTQPILTSLAWDPPLPGANPCADGGGYHDRIAPNVAIIANLLLPDGTPAGASAPIPFRCHPLHQNNLCTYVLNPLIDLPGSSELGLPPFQDPTVTDFSRMRLSVSVFYHDQNKATGIPGRPVPPGPHPPVNMGVCGFFAETMQEENHTASFTVNHEGRYVNAPVCPNALYFSMGAKGIGAVDLDGNGFTTNDPDFSKPALVTSQKFYNKFGNQGMGIGNNYSYAAKATRPEGGGTPTYMGLGSITPMPGINEGSTGMDELVRDSNGNVQLFPDPTVDGPNFEMSDLVVGDFLDTLFFDETNRYVEDKWRLSAVDQKLGKYSNNLIATPPTPNPPPLTLPIGMSAPHVILDQWGCSEEGAFVIMGKEVFTVDIQALGYNPVAVDTGFIHLFPAAMAGSPTDLAFPPNPSQWLGMPMDYMNTGPLAESSTLGTGAPYGSRQQIGNFLFAADKANDEIKVLNSNTMEVIASLGGVHAPESLAVSSDLSELYVANPGNGSVSVFDVNPRTPNFLSLITKVRVGDQPRGIACQPDGEDVFVCNYGSDTISIIDPKTHTVRKTLRNLVSKPWDMVVGPRQTTHGFWTSVYHGYIANQGGDNVLVYESGPDGLGGIGYDDIIGSVRVGSGFLPIQSPRGLCWDPMENSSGQLAGGCFVAHASGDQAMVSRIQFTRQSGGLGPAYPLGSKRRLFEVVQQWGGSTQPLSGTAAMDVALLDYNREAWLNNNWAGDPYVTNLGDLGSNPHASLPSNSKHPIRFVNGAVVPTVVPDRLFISFENEPVIDVIDPNSAEAVLKTITGLPEPVRVLKPYFKD